MGKWRISLSICMPYQPRDAAEMKSVSRVSMRSAVMLVADVCACRGGAAASRRPGPAGEVNSDHSGDLPAGLFQSNLSCQRSWTMRR